MKSNCDSPLLAICLTVIVLPLLIQGVINGDLVEWNRYGYLVKVLARNSDNGAVQNCVGTIISPSLILTSPECIKNNTLFTKLDEFVVIVSHLKKTNGKNEKVYNAKLIEVTNNWALLKMKSLDIEELCPPDPAPKRVAQLPINPSLSNPSIIELHPDLYRRSNCYMVAFETALNASAFAQLDERQQPLRINLEALIDANDSEFDLYQSRIVQNSTACYDDMGAAVICHIMPQDRNLHVGMFRFLNFYQSTNINRTNIETCTLAQEMKFSMLSGDQHLVDAIQRNNFAQFIKVYKACNFFEPE